MKKPLHIKILAFLFPILRKHDREVFGKMGDKDKFMYWYLPHIFLCLLPVVAFYCLFSESFTPNRVMFSNDGPVGVMNSDWVRSGYPPGQPMWNDSWWLGTGSGSSPIMFTNFFYWICTTPEAFIGTVLISIALIIYALRNRYNKSLLPYEPEGCEDDTSFGNSPVDQSTTVFMFRCLFIVMLSRFTWVYFAAMDKPWDIKDVLFPLEGIAFLGYALLGLPFWFCAEMENHEYLRSKRLSK